MSKFAHKAYVVLSKNTGELGIIVPLYPILKAEMIYGVEFTQTGERPLAYIVDAGQKGLLPILDAEFVNERVEVLGEL
jgi:hypothetical protein